MARKNIQVVYTVNDAALLKSAAALRANEDAAKKADSAATKFGKSAKTAGDGASKSFLNLGTIWKGLVAIGVTAFFVNLAKKTFELGVKQEQLNIAFTTFLGSAEKAKKLLQDLTKFAIVTPFTPDQVNNAAKALLAFGVAGRDIIPTLKMLGDVSSGTGKDLTEMAIIFGQIRSTGRLMGQDLLQLINAGFNPLQIISEQTGKSVGRLKAEMEKGLVSFEMVSDAFKSATSEGGRFFNLMEKQSQSIGGLLSTVEGNIDEILKNLFTATSGPVKDFVDQLVRLSEAFLELSKSQQQIADESFARSVDEGVKKLQEFIDKTGDISKGITQFNNELDRERDLLIARKKALEDGTAEETEFSKSLQLSQEDVFNGITLLSKEYDLTLQRIATIEVERKGIGELTKARKEANEAAETKELAKQLEAEALAREKLLAARKKLITDLLNDPIVEQDAPTPLEGDPFGFFPEGWREVLEADSQAMLGIIKSTDDEILQSHMDTEKAKTEATDREEKRRRDLRQVAFDFGIDLLGQFLSASLATEEEDTAGQQREFDRRIENAGDNKEQVNQIRQEQERFEIESRKRAAEQDKRAQIKQMIITSLLNALRALGTPPVPNFSLAGVTAAYGLASVGIAQAVGFKDGGWIEGPGTPTSDSVPIMASRNEFMVNARSAGNAPNLLEAINSGEIDDRILRQVRNNQAISIEPMDDRRIVDAVDRLASRSSYEEGHFTVNRVAKSKNLTTHIKSKFRS